MKVVLRHAAPIDASGISALIASLERHRAADLSVPPPRAFAAGFSVETLREILADTRYGYLVALMDGSIVGVLGVRDRFLINHFFVATPYQGQGIGRQLWTLALQESLFDVTRRRTVKSSLAAVPVYRKLGFQETGPVVHEPGLSYVPMEQA